jgi:ribosomal protein S14
MDLKLDDATKFRRRVDACQPEESVMTKLENRCSHCGGKFGLVCYHHWGLRFCRKACKNSFNAKTAKGYACMRRWFGFSPRGAA